MPRQDLPRPGVALVGAHNDVEHAGRQRGAQELADAQRRKRCLRCGLQDHGVPACQRAGRRLPTQHDRRIPRGYDGNYTQWAPPQDNALDAVVGQLLLRLYVEQPGGVLEGGGGHDELDARLVERPPAFVRLQRGKRLHIAAQQRGALPEAGGPLRMPQVGPAAGSAVGSLNGPLQLRDRGLWRQPDQVPSGWAVHPKGLVSENDITLDQQRGALAQHSGLDLLPQLWGIVPAVCRCDRGEEARTAEAPALMPAPGPVGCS
mmetsp:Transcript_15897/g.50882  ORF Transcript_15897/g.50882 Transcript_15897/m.50882 type:complete len:261 (+) Transcript_15897:309-1091(+)